MHACMLVLMINVVSLLHICAYTFELSLFMNISVLSWLNGIDTFFGLVCMHACMLVHNLRECIFLCFTEALYEKKQSIVAYDPEVAKLQAQVEQWESTAKGSQGKVIG